MLREFTPLAVPTDGDAALRQLHAEQLGLEAALRTYLHATVACQSGEREGKLLKRDCIKHLVEQGTAVTRAEKEYVDLEGWQDHVDAQAALDEAKRAAEVDLEIARSRFQTARAMVDAMGAITLGLLAEAASAATDIAGELTR